MSARPLEGDPVALAADRRPRDVPLGPAVDRKKRRDPVLVLSVVQEILHATQIPFPFFSDIPDEQDVGRRLELPGVEGADEREHERQSAGVVTDARRRQAGPRALHRHVRALREHRVEMSDEGEHGGVTRPLAHAHHVPLGVHFHAAETRIAKRLKERVRPTLLLEGGSRDLGERNQLAHETVVVRADERPGVLELRAPENARDERVRTLGGWPGERKHHADQDASRPPCPVPTDHPRSLHRPRAGQTGDN